MTTTGSAFAQFLPKIAHVVSAKDRAQADADYQEAFTAFQGGDYPKCLGLIEQADRLKPDQPDGWNLRGMALLRQKDYARAQVAFARATALDPELWAARFNLAETSFQQKDYARAQKEFERLLAQTNRFKAANRWELVQYKVFLSCLLRGDAKEAARKLARLPNVGAATPARLYAEAALDYQAKRVVPADKSVASAQAAFPAPVNALFADALVQAGWQAPAPLPANGTNAALAVNSGLPPGVTLATSIPGQSPPPYYAVDPRLEAAVAEPLPLPDTGTQPIVGKLTPALRSLPTDSPPPAAPITPAVPVVATQKLPAPEATPDVQIEHRDLLLVD